MGKRLVGQMKKTLTPALSKFCASAHWPMRRGLWRHPIARVVALAAMAAGGLLRWQQSALSETSKANKPLVNQLDSWLAWSLR
ncbi:hypothetical protein PSH87_13180 [Pseudomonas sp. FP453]|jgi:hypothetical protein|uniref:hypothetical protein n=1 Tax=unclassified Pseudomonas TaxID=196821 RepID=UPI0015A51670|nr:MULTISPECIES: hypothetical protein [unclassified Pseudomonas]WLH92856.1 hypothetical protein PSH87_13180 [Pseudomonas sp. FP453]